MSRPILPAADLTLSLVGLLVAFTLSDPAELRAQAAPEPVEVEVGTRVRAEYAEGRELRGTVLEREERFLVIEQDERPGTPLRVPLGAIDRLYAWGCCSSGKGFRNGALIGSAIALGGGAILQTLPSEHGPNMAMVGAVLVGVPMGILIGGLVGKQVFSPEAWIEVPLP